MPGRLTMLWMSFCSRRREVYVRCCGHDADSRTHSLLNLSSDESVGLSLHALRLIGAQWMCAYSQCSPLRMKTSVAFHRDVSSPSAEYVSQLNLKMAMSPSVRILTFGIS